MMKTIKTETSVTSTLRKAGICGNLLQSKSSSGSLEPQGQFHCSVVNL